MTAPSTPTVRLPVGAEGDSDSGEGVVCPRCVASEGLDGAPDLGETIGTHPLPMAVVVGPVPHRESVPVRGWYCETHDVLLPQAYNDAAADGQVRIDEWLSLPIRTETGQHLLVPVHRAGLLDTTENGSGVGGSEGGRGE